MVDIIIRNLKDEIIEELESWTRITEKTIDHRWNFADREEFYRVIGVLRMARKAIGYKEENTAQLELPFGEVA